MIQSRKGENLLVSALVTPGLSYAVRQSLSSAFQATFLTANVGNSVVPSTDPIAKLLLGLLGIVINDPTKEVGLTCSPISNLGAGANKW